MAVSNMKRAIIGFLGLGVMGLPMAVNVIKKSGCPVLGYDIDECRMHRFVAAGGSAARESNEIYENCDIILQILPTHETISDSVKRAAESGKPGNIIVDLSSAAPHHYEFGRKRKKCRYAFIGFTGKRRQSQGCCRNIGHNDRWGEICF